MFFIYVRDFTLGSVLLTSLLTSSSSSMISSTLSNSLTPRPFTTSVLRRSIALLTLAGPDVAPFKETELLNSRQLQSSCLLYEARIKTKYLTCWDFPKWQVPCLFSGFPMKHQGVSVPAIQLEFWHWVQSAFSQLTSSVSNIHPQSLSHHVDQIMHVVGFCFSAHTQYIYTQVNMFQCKTQRIKCY